MYDTFKDFCTHRFSTVATHVQAFAPPLTPRHLSWHGRNQCQVPSARKQQHTVCHHQLQITSQVHLQGPKGWNSLGARLGLGGGWIRTSHLCEMMLPYVLKHHLHCKELPRIHVIGKFTPELSQK
jgi:hypothetical protein